ncbi:MAG: replication-associated recombination protein A [Bacteroidota bacterium]|nr:replication-associated recombination protein A [Bacteroidota bacterium]
MKNDSPLAERVRPRIIDEIVGQSHLLGPKGVLRKVVESGRLPSMIFWGPPGVGKTTLAYLLAQELDYQFFALSAIQSGVKEVRTIIDAAGKLGKVILFIDEIHRFNKSQQDALLGAVEKGTITLIGATTENPSFEVINALLSRCQVYVLKSLTEEELLEIMKGAMKKDEWLSAKNIILKETDALMHFAGGDARKLLNILELVAGNNASDNEITNEKVFDVLQRRTAQYDKGGEMHYDVISAFIKSMRGSDPNGAIYWLARMLEAGEDPLFIARRMLILASEDIGNANPNALLLATACFQAVERIGMPESRIILAQTVTYLASSPKSNASYEAINEAQALVRKTGDLQVPLHLRNAVTGLMKSMDYGKNYKYAHSYELNFAEQEFLPDKIKNTKLYDPGNTTREDELRKFLKIRWKEKYSY